MKNIIHNTVDVQRDSVRKRFYNLYWADDNGENLEYIVSVHGFENAVRVANRIAHDQVEYVKHPPFDIDLDD